jgi:trk system potassium uptake protein TrkA
MRALIVGAGRLGRALAQELLAAGHDVRILDADEELLARLPATLEGRALHGSPLDRGTLAGALAGCDGLATVTPDDALNVIAALAARRELGVPVAVAVVRETARAAVVAGLGIHVQCPTARTARDLHAVLGRSPAENELELAGDAGVYRIELAARMTGRSLADLSRRGELVPVAVERDGRVLLATPDLVIEDGDVLHAAASHPELVAELAHP